MSWEDILKKPYFTDGRLRAIERKIEDRRKKELEVKRQSSKKVRDAKMRELEEEFGNVTDSPSFGQPQPEVNQQRKGKKAGFGMAGNKTNPLPSRARRKARNIPYNPFSGKGRQVGKKKHHHKYVGDKK
tara:strand:+ start:15602 stop:15988 length:387 start_codon:yes stop_codon:yes gene_type:complete